MDNHMNTAKPQFSNGTPKVEGGFSLIELMVSIVLGLFIVISMLLLYSNMSQSNRELAKSNMLIENGRFSIQLLTEDIQHAGFWGGYVPDYDNPISKAAPTHTPASIPDPCAAFSDGWNAEAIDGLLGITVQAADAAPGTCSTIVANQQAGTDVLVVRHAETCVAGQALANGGTCANTAGQVYLQSSRCATNFNAFLLGDTTSGTLTNKDCTTQAPARQFIQNVYYIRNFAEVAGDGIPTLMRSSFSPTGQQAAVPLIRGIERLVVELGIDDKSKTNEVVDLFSAILWSDPLNKNTPKNRGDGIPDRFVRCTTTAPCSLADLTNVVAVKIYVLARNLEATVGYTDNKTYTLGGVTITPANDHFQRHVFSTTVRVQNVSGRREMP